MHSTALVDVAMKRLRETMKLHVFGDVDMVIDNPFRIPSCPDGCENEDEGEGEGEAKGEGEGWTLDGYVEKVFEITGWDLTSDFDYLAEK